MPATAQQDTVYRKLNAQDAVPTPEIIAGDLTPLGISSILADLPLYDFSVTADGAIQDLIERFTEFPDLPGAIFSEANRTSVLSRQHFLECLLKLGQTSLFVEGSIHLILSQANPKALCLPSSTSILLGAQQALKRPHDQQSDPILVQHADGFSLLDARTLNVAHWQIRGIETQIRYERLQMQLLQSEKMAALGRLVDGVAHEILDPVSFIWGNLTYIADYARQQSDLIAAYAKALPEPESEILQLREEIEFDYLSSDLPAAIKSAKGGANRLKQLATSLQTFCHIDEIHPRPTDLNSLLDGTLRLLKSRLDSPIQIERCYGKLPPVPCFAGQLSQVFMNIFTNAIDSLLAQAQLESYASESGTAIGISPGKPSQVIPQITVTTCVRAEVDTAYKNPLESRWVSIIISDNGPGLQPATKAQIINSFSPKSRSRKETGLAMSYQIVTAKHGGRLWIRSFHASEVPAAEAEQVTTGTEFEILLPLTSGEAE